jgi:hypothetical protein
MVADACNSSITQEQKQEDHKFEAGLHSESLFQKKKRRRIFV